MWHAGQRGHILFLDRDRWRCRYDDNRYRQLATHDTHGLRMDGNIMRLGRIGALPVDQMFRSGRGELCATFCLFATGLCLGNGMWFFGETLEFMSRWGRDCCVRRPVYIMARATTGLIPLAWLQSLWEQWVFQAAPDKLAGFL